MKTTTDKEHSRVKPVKLMTPELVLCWLLLTLSSFVISALSNNAQGRHTLQLLLLYRRLANGCLHQHPRQPARRICLETQPVVENYTQKTKTMTVCLRDASAAAVAFLPSLLPLMDGYYTDMEEKLQPNNCHAMLFAELLLLFHFIYLILLRLLLFLLFLRKSSSSSSTSFSFSFCNLVSASPVGSLTSGQNADILWPAPSVDAGFIIPGIFVISCRRQWSLILIQSNLNILEMLDSMEEKKYEK